MDLSWDERWQQKIEEAIPAPDPWLLKHQGLLTAGKALDLACGRGRNSLLLGKLGYRVLAVDSSPTALALLRSAAAEKGLEIEVMQHNLETGLPAPPDSFDLVLCFYYLQRGLFAAIKNRIAPGGLFIGRSFCQSNPADEANDIIYAAGELAELFSGWEILAYEEGAASNQRGGTLAGIVARRPPA